MAKRKPPQNSPLGAALDAAMKGSTDLKSQLALSKRSGVPQTTIGRILRGSSDPGVETIRRLARALKVPVSVLFGEDVQGTEPGNGTSRELRVVSGTASQSGRLDFPMIMAAYQRLVGHFDMSGSAFDPDGDAALLVSALNYAMEPTPERLEERDRRSRELLERRKGTRDGRSTATRNKPAR